MSYDYATWINTVAVIVEYDATITDASSAAPSSAAQFNIAYPRAIEYAEQRIYRELDLVNTSITDDTGSFTANSRRVTLPTTQGDFVVVEQVAPVVDGVRQTLMLPTSREYIDACWPAEASGSSPSIPQFWSLIDQGTILVGPPPDQDYGVEVVGTVRPEPLSATNTTTFLTDRLPDLFLAASLIFWFGYQRDFGGQATDPATAQSWQAQYDALMKSAATEEARKQFASTGWQGRNPQPLATPPQT